MALAKARVLEQADYDKWYAEFKASAPPGEADGYLLLRNTGCIACHSLDGTKLVGPSFKGLFGKERSVFSVDTQITVIADENYIQNSIYNPDSQVVTGYNKGIMKSYRDLLKDAEIITITDYLKTLGEK